MGAIGIIGIIIWALLIIIGESLILSKKDNFLKNIITEGVHQFSFGDFIIYNVLMILISAIATTFICLIIYGFYELTSSMIIGILITIGIGIIIKLAFMLKKKLYAVFKERNPKVNFKKDSDEEDD